MCRGIIELKTNPSILDENGLFANKTPYGLTPLFGKRKI